MSPQGARATRARVYPKSTESVPPIHWPVAHCAARIRIVRMNNALHQRRPSMQRIAFFLYGLSAHALFFVVYAWLIGFVTNLVLPTTIDRPALAGTQWWLAVCVDALLLVTFGVQHSVMA